MSTKVFLVGENTDKPYQSLVFAGDDEQFRVWRPRLRLDGVSRLADWEPPPLHRIDRDAARPDVWLCWVLYAPLLSHHAATVLAKFVAESGELLPLPIDDQILSVLNVTRVVDCLDPKTSRRVAANYVEWGFLPHALPTVSVFKVPEQPTRVLAVERTDDRTNSLRHVASEAGISGLQFTELWDSEQGPLYYRPSLSGTDRAPNDPDG